MMHLAEQFAPLSTLAADKVTVSLEWAKFIPWVPLLGSALCCLCCTRRSLWWVAGPICVLSIFISFLIALATFFGGGLQAAGGHATITFFKWITAGKFDADFGYYLDTLTYLMLFVVTGIGTLIAWYATGYMKGDKGYARFFAGMSIFIFAMTNLVMADNLVLLYLGWEGVGFASWFLIGFYYDKLFAVAAAKKAFIVNRIGDLGFALGLFLTYMEFGSVEYSVIFEKAAELWQHPDQITLGMHIIPFLLMAGAFGKSAQFLLYVWLPDAMAGPTPVSALVHAATMVTSGVYMIARLTHVFELSPYAMPVVALIGGVTCFYAATIALCNNDLKGVFAYSTISQLGYMFLGVGALSTFGGLFHLFTHAWFKALLFLTAGSVMHALAGQLDIRTMRGMGRWMPWTKWLMFCGCLALAGFPLTSGFFSKDTVLAESLATGMNGSRMVLIGAILGIVTAALTAFYTFRLWFIVFTGEPRYEMGEDHHAEDDNGFGHGDHGHDSHAHHEPHEMPFFRMNAPLVILAAGALAGGLIFASPIKHWVKTSSADASAAPIELSYGGDKAHRAVTLEQHHDALFYTAGGGDAEHHDHHPHHATLLGFDIHDAMMGISGTMAVLAILLAGFFYFGNNIHRAKATAERFPRIVTLLQNKYYVDELYDKIIVRPLRLKAHLFFVIDQLVLDAMVQAAGWLPGNVLGKAAQKTQSGRLQGYGLGMAAGIAVLAVVVFIVLN